MRGAFRIWWNLAVEVVGTKDREVSWSDFLTAWNLCPFQTRGVDVKRLLESSQSVDLSSEADSLSDNNLKTLLRACVILQGLHGREPFYLSGEDAGRILGKSQPTGFRALTELMKRGFLERVSVGSNLTGKASFYRVRVA